MFIKIVIVRCQRQTFAVTGLAIINVAIISVVVVFVVFVVNVSHIDDGPDWHVHVLLLRVHSVLIGVYTGCTPENPFSWNSPVSRSVFDPFQHEWVYIIHL
jgi:hypothetical protein